MAKTQIAQMVQEYKNMPSYKRVVVVDKLVEKANDMISAGLGRKPMPIDKKIPRNIMVTKGLVLLHLLTLIEVNDTAMDLQAKLKFLKWRDSIGLSSRGGAGLVQEITGRAK